MAYPGRSASYARYRAAQSVLDCGGPLPLWEPDEPRTSKVLGGWFAAQLGTAHKAPEDWRSPRRSASSAGSRTAQSALDCGGRAQRRHRFGVSERNGIGKSFVPIPNSAGVVRVSGDSPACFGVFPPSAPIGVHLTSPAMGLGRIHNSGNFFRLSSAVHTSKTVTSGRQLKRMFRCGQPMPGFWRLARWGRVPCPKGSATNGQRRQPPKVPVRL